jgi:hypothetical protein
MIDQHEHTNLTGPAATDAAHRLEQFGQAAHFAGSVVTDPRRLRRLLRRDDPAIYPGTYVTCVFNPDTALCLKPGRTDHPQLADCQPLKCRNVALTHDNITAWHDEINAIDQRLHRAPPLPPLLATRLRQRHDELTDFLSHHGRGEA